MTGRGACPRWADRYPCPCRTRATAAARRRRARLLRRSAAGQRADTQAPGLALQAGVDRGLRFTPGSRQGLRRRRAIAQGGRGADRRQAYRRHADDGRDVERHWIGLTQARPAGAGMDPDDLRISLAGAQEKTVALWLTAAGCGRRARRRPPTFSSCPGIGGSYQGRLKCVSGKRVVGHESAGGIRSAGGAHRHFFLWQPKSAWRRARGPLASPFGLLDQTDPEFPFLCERTEFTRYKDFHYHLQQKKISTQEEIFQYLIVKNDVALQEIVVVLQKFLVGNL